jgi:hypothetical protein
MTSVTTPLEEAPMALQGDLDSFALPDVLKLLAGTAKSGRLAVTGPIGTGVVWLDAGELVGGDVTTAPFAEGTEDVVFELLRFSGGSFAFDDGERLVESGSRISVDEALDRAGALLAEWADAESVVPTMDAWATLATDLEGDGVHIDADRWRVLAAIGGGRSAAELAGDLGMGDLAICQRLKALVEIGVVTIGTAPVEPTPAEEIPAPSDLLDDTPEADPASDLALLSADSAPVVLESSVDALLPEPLPGAGTSYTDDDSATGVVDRRVDDDLDVGVDPAPAGPVGIDDSPSGADRGWGIFDPSELADARSEHLAASPGAWDDGWRSTADEADRKPAGPDGGPEATDADRRDHRGDDETDRGSLLKFLSSVKP